MIPRPAAYEALSISVRDWGSQQNWINYETFLFQKYSKKYAKDLIKYSKKYSHCLKTGNLSELKTISKNMKLHAMKALSALSKFSGCYNYYKDLIKAYDLKWTVDNDDVIISRLNRYHNNGSKKDLFDWIKTIKKKLPEFALFMDFILATGMRFNEAIKSYNLIIKLKHENRFEEYYNREEQTLEHFRFQALIHPKNKEAFHEFYFTKYY